MSLRSRSSEGWSFALRSPCWASTTHTDGASWRCNAIGIVRRAASTVRTAKMGSDNTASVGPTRGLELPAARRAG